MALFRKRKARKPTASEVAAYGSLTRRNVTIEQQERGFRPVDVAKASRELKVSAATVRSVIKESREALHNKIFRRLSGRAGADVRQGASVTAMLIAAYGHGPRGGTVNARAAARDLGVSTGTVRRWAAGKQQPSPEHLDGVERAARRTANTKSGRKKAVDDFRKSKQGRKALVDGAGVWVDGYQGPAGDEDYCRDRLIHFDTPLNPDEVDALLRAYEDGGDAGFIEMLHELAGKHYLEDWDFRTIEDFAFESPRRR